MNPLIPKTRNWDRQTPADGHLFETEFLAVYQNLTEVFNFANLQLGNQKGFVQGRLRNITASPTVIKAVRNNVYEVDENLIKLNGELTLDFSSLTNIFRNDGITGITATSETQNKHLYVLLTSTGSLHGMIVSDSEMEGSTHNYENNPLLLKDYYAVSPGIFNPTKNGYYKNGKRIIGCIRLNASNQIEFVYELGLAHRFMDTQSSAIGTKFTETRWKREHPACYVPDGSTVTNMNLEAPELFRILGSNILPDWTDRFARNISPNSTRSLRDTQEDAIQGFGLSSATESTLVTGSGFMSGPGSYNASGSVSVSAPYDIGFGIPDFDFETRAKNYSVSTQIVRG